MPDTITIEPHILVIAVISVTAWMLGIIAVKLVARIRERKSEEEKQEERQKQAELAELFPGPWLKAYKECEAAGDWRVRLIWLKAWLKQQRDVPFEHGAPVALPGLSLPAISRFAKMVGGSSWDERFERAIETLTPFFRLLSESHDAEEANKIHHTMCQCHSSRRT